MKPGYKTSEGWLTATTLLLSMLYALGLVGDGQGTPDKIAAFIGSALASAGYAVSRGRLKSGAPSE